MITKDTGIQFNSMVKSLGLGTNLTKLITAQAAHETGGFTSSIYRNNNNAFGMKYAGQNTARGEKNGYAYYNTVYESIQDYYKWYLRHSPWLLMFDGLVNPAMFVAWLKKGGYFEDTVENYKKGVEYFYNKIFA